MKTLLTLAFLCLIGFIACKKSQSSHPFVPPAPAPITVAITGLTANTAVTIKMVSKATNTIVLAVTSPSKGNQTYTTDPVPYGDAVQVDYSANIPCNDNGDGKGSITFTYNGKSIDPLSGCLQSRGFILSAF